MNYNDAVAVYQKSPTSETLKEVCKQLCSEMTLREKLKMLSGRQFAMRNCYDLLTKGRKYNYRPCIAGGIKRLGIPTVAFSDGPRGVVMGKSTCFPVSMARGASFNDELEYEVGTAIAKEVIAGGANYFAGICINLLRNPRWGRAQETYGEDPFLLGKMGAALTKAVQDNGVIACPKHFACNSIENIRFSVDVHADEKTLQEVYFPHFKKCIDTGAMSIMGAYNLLRGEHCCESKYLFTDVLRDQWHFEGFAITDFLFALRNGERAVKAGMDVEMPMKILYTMLPIYLRNGKISQDDIDKAVRNVLTGLIKITPKIKHQSKDVIACKSHAMLAKKVACEGTVLLKNNGILPLSDVKKIAVVGRYANKINVGDHGSSSVASPYTVTPYKGLCNAFGKENVVLCESLDISSKLDEIKSCSCVLICVGSDYKQEGENLANFSSKDGTAEKAHGGDRYSLRIPSNEVELIHRICADCENTIVDIVGGSAYVIEEWKDEASAILHSFYSGMEGGNALADILTGKEVPSGHLPFTIAKDENDYPKFLFPGEKTRVIDYGYYHGYTLLDKEGKEAAFPFGFGLSYTEFEYSDIHVENKDGSIEVSLKIKNIGSFDGKTVVQVYAGANGDHPVKLLKGFKKVNVPAGKEIEETVTVYKDDLKFYDEKAGEWYLENEYTFYVGQNSADAMNNKLTVSV